MVLQSQFKNWRRKFVQQNEVYPEPDEIIDTIVAFALAIANSELWENVQTQRFSWPWFLPSHLFIATWHSKAQKTQAAYGPTSSRYETRAALHRSSVDCEIWFHEGIDKIWRAMNTEYHFCCRRPLWTQTIIERGGVAIVCCNKFGQNGAICINR